MAERRVRLTGIQRKVAEAVTKSASTIPQVTTIREVCVDVLLQVKERGAQAHGRLTLMPFLIRAVASSLGEFPALNASLEEEEIVYHDVVNIGVAVAAGNDLVVPVIKDVNSLSFGDLVDRLRDISERARNRKLEPADFRGGTFTVSNSGSLGGEIFTPIINYPQSGILGVGRVKRKPVVDEDGTIVARSMMYLCLSYDHRIVNGRDAVLFLASVERQLESEEQDAG